MYCLFTFVTANVFHYQFCTLLLAKWTLTCSLSSHSMLKEGFHDDNTWKLKLAY
uniref:Uncharacterized protein n=1 Tax=Octopus bimaculoides TaxID=37653 RepID=A0A0L8HVG4_OCTBM